MHALLEAWKWWREEFSILETVLLVVVAGVTVVAIVSVVQSLPPLLHFG